MLYKERRNESYKEFSIFTLIICLGLISAFLYQYNFGWSAISSLIAVVCIPAPLVLFAWILKTIEKLFPDDK